MKKFKDENNVIYAFDLDCFDEQGNCINEIALKIITENSLIEMTDEEYNIYVAKKEVERLAEEKTQKELSEANKLIEFYENLLILTGVQ